MTVKTEGQHFGEHIVSLFNGAPSNGGDISLEKVIYQTGHGVVKDGTVLRAISVTDGVTTVAPAAGSVDTAGDSDEDVFGTAYGNYDTSNGQAPKGAAVARLAVLNTELITTSGSKSALVAALAKLFIIVR